MWKKVLKDNRKPVHPAIKRCATYWSIGYDNETQKKEENDLGRGIISLIILQPTHGDGITIVATYW